MRKICYAEMNLVKVPMVISQRNQSLPAYCSVQLNINFIADL